MYNLLREGGHWVGKKKLQSCESSLKKINLGHKGEGEKRESSWLRSGEEGLKKRKCKGGNNSLCIYCIYIWRDVRVFVSMPSESAQTLLAALRRINE